MLLLLAQISRSHFEPAQVWTLFFFIQVSSTMDTQTQRKLGTNIYITALDSTVNVNSLFMLAVFIGLTWNPTDPRFSLVEDLNCLPSAAAAEDLISFQVYSFGCFLFSSLVSLSLKQSLKIAKNTDAYNSMMARVNQSMLRVGILCVSVGSVCGCGFLMLALINLVQFKLGKLSCSSKYSVAAVVPLVILVPSALLIYVGLVLYAFTR